MKVQRIGVDAKTTDYGSTATQVASSGAQAVFYGGYDAQAGLVAQALAAANFKGDKYTGNGGKSSVFTDGAGAAGDGWDFTCGCSDATGEVPAVGEHRGLATVAGVLVTLEAGRGQSLGHRPAWASSRRRRPPGAAEEAASDPRRARSRWSWRRRGPLDGHALLLEAPLRAPLP